MRKFGFALIVSSALAGAAYAADKPVIGPTPDWVKLVAIPSAPDKSDEAPARVLLSDQQVALEVGRQTVYSEYAVKIQTPQGLAAGNISFPWRPDTDVLTVHKVVIRRGDQTIDVLASGQTFTVVRREQNLDNAMLDGVLTANIQPEGLQVGDILDFAVSLTSSDPTLKGHVEQIVGGWGGMPLGRVHVRIQWPTALRVRLRPSAGLPALKPVKSGNITAVEFSIDNVRPVVPAKYAPPRYRIGQLLEVSDFGSWADLGALMAPLYQKAAILPADGPLHAELERMKSLSPDPLVRAQAALALVQDRVRYVALAMGTGGYVPADAEETWARRFGDCKGKTALLIGLLRSMDIEADPVAVSSDFGDGMDVRLPMVGLFNHVLVRAVIGGKTYWLDGTRTGDTSLERLTVPAFGWGLPLRPSGAVLVRMMPPPLTVPTVTTAIHIDAAAGVMIPAPMKVETVMRGDEATAINANLANLSGDLRDHALRQYWKNQYDFVDVKSASARFDTATGELRILMEGVAKMDWSSGWYETDGTGVGYKADFSRDPGRDQDAPFAVSYPYYTKLTETIILPPSFAQAKAGAAANLDRTVAGVEYHRRSQLVGTVFSIEKTERSITPEFPASEAASAQEILRDLANQTIYIRKPASYRQTEQEFNAMMATTPSTIDAFLDRGHLLMDRERFDEALKDYDAALALDPKNSAALANRGLTYVWKKDLAAAAKDLDTAAAFDPKNPVVFRARGLAAQQTGDFAKAIAFYTTSLELDPNNHFALYRRAMTNAAFGNDQAALQDADAALKVSPHAMDLYLLKANIFRRQGKEADAIQQAVDVEAANPGETYAHVLAGNIYGTFHRNAEAASAFGRALAIKPEPYIYLNRSYHHPKGDVAARRADIEAALALDPKLPASLIEKAKLQMEGGDFAGAATSYTAAMGPTPGSSDLLARRGTAFVRAGDTARGEKDFAEARAMASTPTEINNMCWTKATAGVVLDAALVDCNAALAKSPEDASFLDSRGLVLLRLGRFDEAIADYDLTLAKRPKMAGSLYGRAVAWARKGDATKSAADLTAATKIDPDIADTFKGYGISLNGAASRDRSPTP